MHTVSVHTTRIGQWIQLLPAALLKPLDAWSHRRARQRAQQRQQRWLQRQAAVAALAPALQHDGIAAK